MTEQNPEYTGESHTVNKKRSWLISLLILAVGAVITLVVFLTEPVAEPESAVSETAMLVEVTKVEQGNFSPSITATGRVIPEQEITLSPRISGEVIKVSENFLPGEMVSKGEVLLQIDPSDYRNALRLRESELMQANADLEMEMGRQYVAQKDFELFEEELPSQNQGLILREPQLQATKSRVEAATASVQQAKLDLQRTTIRAPFDAQILNRAVNVGSQVSPGDNLAHLVGTATYWIEVSVPPSRLQWLEFPVDNNGKGSEVQVRNRTAWTRGQYRKGYLYQLIGTLEEQTRLARVLVSVPDPLSINADNQLPLMIGSFVEVSVRGKEIPDAIRIDRNLIRQNETVWLMRDDRLTIRDVDILLRDEKYAYVSSGLSPDDQVVVTNLATVAEGARLRVAEIGELTAPARSGNVQEDTLDGNTSQIQD